MSTYLNNQDAVYFSYPHKQLMYENIYEIYLL